MLRGRVHRKRSTKLIVRSGSGEVETRLGSLGEFEMEIALDSEGQLVGKADMKAQVAQAYVNVKEVLETFGASMDDVVDETWFVTDVSEVMGDSEYVFGARVEAYGGVPEVCQTLIGISGLVMPELKIEIKCIAELG